MDTYEAMNSPWGGLTGSPFGAVGKTENENKETVQAWRQGRGLLPDLTFQLTFVPLLDHKVCVGGALP